MIEGPTSGMWEELRTNKPVADDALATAPACLAGAATGILYAMDQMGDLHLLIPVQGGPAGQKTPDLRGLRVRHRRLADGGYLDLEATACHERIFAPLCAEILTAVVERKRKPWEAVATIIRAWQSAWKPATPAMEKTAQVGLFGELLVLERILIPIVGSRAVFQWSGPDAERHDFVGTALHLEVKTTRKGRHEHEISRLDQLRVPEGRRLVVVSILVEESATGAETVATRIDQVIESVRSDSAACDDFLAKIARLGWSDGLRDSGELLRFHLRDDHCYHVDESFPRLPDDLHLPSGVVSVRYVVDLANLPSLGLEEIQGWIRDWF
jgi:hypothetical protein